MIEWMNELMNKMNEIQEKFTRKINRTYFLLVKDVVLRLLLIAEEYTE